MNAVSDVDNHRFRKGESLEVALSTCHVPLLRSGLPYFKNLFKVWADFLTLRHLSSEDGPVAPLREGMSVA